MNIQQLRELAKLADSEVTWILLPKDLANEGWCTEVVNYISVVSPSTITALVDRIEAAEREHDELRKLSVTRIILDITPGENGMGHEIHAKSVSEVESLISSLYERLEAAEAEIARRDAAASERAGIVEVWPGTRSCDFLLSRPLPVGQHNVYTAAPPVALPPKLSISDAVGMRVSLCFIEGYNQCRTDALALGAQPQKPVVLPALFNLKMAGDVKTRQYFKGSNDTIKQIAGLLDAANVPYEVNK